MALTEAQQLLTQLIEDSMGDQIDAIGEPVEKDGVIEVSFQYGDDVYDAVIDPDGGTIRY